MLQYQERGKMGGEKFHIRKGSLTFSADSIDMDLVPGAAYEGSFTIYGPEGRTANGFVLSSEPAVRLMTNIFSGGEGGHFLPSGCCRAVFRRSAGWEFPDSL